MGELRELNHGFEEIESGNWETWMMEWRELDESIEGIYWGNRGNWLRDLNEGIMGIH